MKEARLFCVVGDAVRYCWCPCDAARTLSAIYLCAASLSLCSLPVHSLHSCRKNRFSYSDYSCSYRRYAAALKKETFLVCFAAS